MGIRADMNYGFDTNILTVITVFFYVLFIITFQALAAVMTIVAATSTAIWNIYKIVMDRRDRRKASGNGTQTNGHGSENIKQDKSIEHE
jgi:hypothetical protein